MFTRELAPDADLRLRLRLRLAAAFTELAAAV
jgi:hypothetical protein